MIKYKDYIHSILWSSGLLYIFFILNFIGQILLARLLVPEHFGLIALSLSIVEILKIFFAFSISLAYIKMKDSETLLGTAFTLAFLGWIMMFVASLLLLYPLSILFSNKVAIYVVIITFFSIFTYLAYIIEADLEKNMKFKKSSFLVGLSTTIASVLAIFFAYNGFEEKSLLIREIAGPLIMFIIIYKYFDKSLNINYCKLELREMYTFVFKMIFSKGSEVIYLKVPLIIISSLFGTSTLGLISQVLYLAQLPSVALGPVVNKVSYVFYSHNNDNKKIQNNGRKIISIFSIIASLPFSLICYFYSQEILTYLWGEKWIDASIYLEQLSLFILLYPLFLNNKTYLFSINRNQVVTFSYIIGALILVFGIISFNENYIGLLFSTSLIIMLTFITLSHRKTI